MILRSESRLLILSLGQSTTQADLSTPLAAIMKAFACMIASEKERMEKADQQSRKNLSLTGSLKDTSVCNADSG
jgi:hypothetical protein